MRLFQSIFGGESRGRYPESLIDLATERAVDGTDPRVRLQPGYRKHLREPILQAIDHVVALVDAIPPPLPAGARQHSTEPRLGAVFASAARMLEILGRDPALIAYLATPEGRGAERVTTLMLAARVERRILGMALDGDQVRRDVPQVAVSFAGHRLLDPSASEAETRRLLKRRAFDHILTLALARIGELKEERADLTRQRDLLRRKLKALQQGGWTFTEPTEAPPDAATLSAELDAITAQLETRGADQHQLRVHLAILGETLADAPRQLWAESLTLCLDPMNIECDARDPSARHIGLGELRNAEGRRLVMLPLVIPPAELPEREDLVSAAARYLQ